MIKAGTLIKFLRRSGIALLFAPEPFTTPFGAALLLAAHYLSRNRDRYLNRRMCEVVKYYLAHTTRVADEGQPKSDSLGLGDRYRGKEQQPFTRQYRPGADFAASFAGAARNGSYAVPPHKAPHIANAAGVPQRGESGNSLEARWALPAMSHTGENVVHHTIDIERLSWRYASEAATVAHAGWTGVSGAPEGVTYHSINMRALSERYRTAHDRQAAIQHHAVDMRSLLRRYAPSLSATAVANAVRENSYYYDIASRPNVIGGY
jgi:hypothetical protein